MSLLYVLTNILCECIKGNIVGLSSDNYTKISSQYIIVIVMQVQH